MVGDSNDHWAQNGQPARITVHPYSPPAGAAAGGAGPEGVDDWLVPWVPDPDASYPEDWITSANAPPDAPEPDVRADAAPYATASNPQPAPNIASNPGRGGIAAPFANSNAVPSPPAVRNPLFPSAAQMGATAWDPPIFPGDWSAIMARYFPATAIPPKPPTLAGPFGQYSSADHVPSRVASVGPRVGSGPLASAPANDIPSVSSFVPRAESQPTYNNQQPWQTFPQSSPDPSRLVPRPAWPAASGDLRNGPVVDRQFGPDTPGTVTRVVRGPTGRAIAIIHAYPAPAGGQLPRIQNDANSEGIRPGARYAQTNNAITNIPVIDRTTDTLLWVLEQSVQAMGDGSGALFGVKVHTDFRRRVEALDLPGIGQTGVEQSFHVDFDDFVRYGLDGSIRTDVILRDPKDPNQRPIAVYDLKTGKAVLKPPRVTRILEAIGDPNLPVIELRYPARDAVRRIGVPKP
jgi:hypothetical protein